MKQLVLDLKSGLTSLLDVPAPLVQDGHLLIRTRVSLVSPGTERMLVNFGKAGWLAKARQQPERVQQVFNKIKTDGLRPTLHAVRQKLEQPMPLGYSQSGTVIGIGKGVQGFALGDRVVSNGPHAGVVLVPKNLVAKIPDAVSDEEAAFTVMGSIALQSMRLVMPTFGETVVVIGLGLLGQLTAQLLAAAGCRVIGFDLDEAKLSLAAERGITTANSSHIDPVGFARGATNGLGVDAVIITASSQSDALISEAAQMCRKRGRIVLSGVTGLNIRRSDFYEKELSFQVSCSYGPGRYDPAYEQGGHDYPLGFVRWTEQRNFEAFLQAIALKQLHLAPLITQRVPMAGFQQIYGALAPSVIAGLLLYEADSALDVPLPTNAPAVGGTYGLGIIGAGSFAAAVMVPMLKKAGADLRIIAAKGGLSAASVGKKYGIARQTSDYRQVLDDPSIHAVCIATRHQEHALMVCEALQAGKHVFVEKPLALDPQGLAAIIETYQPSGKQLFVGFNRRFAPFAQKMKALLRDVAGPLQLVMTVNAGSLPERHWLNDPQEGGRLIGEACHFIDLCAFLAEAPVVAVTANAVGADNASILLRLANGSSAVINYFTNGAAAYDKERIEVFGDGRTLILENWRKLTGYGFKGFSGMKAAQDKGHQEQFAQIVASLNNGGPAPIPFAALVNTTRASFAAVESLQSGAWITVPQ